jgi:hypothetical protein
MKRSDRVFDALHTLRNRYMLCQLASKATRKFQKPNTSKRHNGGLPNQPRRPPRVVSLPL